jgi:carbon-monoxide dehydrogenase medium subunit
MKPATFEYHAPTSVDEAVGLLHDLRDEEPKLLAGGQSLVPTMNLRLARPTSIIDLNHTVGLSGVIREGDEWRIGAMTRHAAVEDSAPLRAEMPLLPEVVSHIGYRPIRNRGTVGGSICHADPAAEWPMLARLVRARLDVRSAGGNRTVSADDFFDGVFTTVLEEDELLTSIRFPAPPTPWQWGFSEFARKVGDFALAAVGVVLWLSDSSISDASIVVAGAGGTPTRLDVSEASLTGAAVDDVEAMRDAAEAAAQAVDPMDDVHANSAYKRRLVAVLVERALAQARNGSHRGQRGTDGTT